MGTINQQDDHEKNRNYWKYLKAKLRKEQNEVVSGTTQLKLTAADEKKYLTDVISQAGVDKLAKAIRNQQAMDFLDWFTYSDNTIDGQSHKKAYTLWESNLVADKDVGKVKSLQSNGGGRRIGTLKNSNIFGFSLVYSYLCAQEDN